jgi:hypothetical protein
MVQQGSTHVGAAWPHARRKPRRLWGLRSRQGLPGAGPLTARDIHIVVATPCFGGLLTQRYMQSVYSLMAAGFAENVKVSVELLGNDSLITRARNTLVQTMMDTPGATHLMFIDADIGFAPDSVGRMIKFDREIVAGMYPLKIIHYDAPVMQRVAGGEPLETAQLRYVGALQAADQRQTEAGFATADYAGTGFMLIKREALERMQKAYPETRYTASHDRATLIKSNNLFALFDCMIDPETGEYLSEDYTFCKRWRAIGGQVWLDTQSQLMHIGPREFHGDMSARAVG